MQKKSNSKPQDSALLRFFRPSMRLYFAVLVIFAALALILRQWDLGAIELAAAVLLLIYSRFVHSRQEHQILEYLGSSVRQQDDMNTNTIMSMPLPLAIFSLQDGTVLWTNDAFLEITGERNHIFEITLADMVPGFGMKW